MHQKRIVHRDLKLENLIFDDHFKLKICDFGFSKKLIDKNEILDDFVGTDGYFCP